MKRFKFGVKDKIYNKKEERMVTAVETHYHTIASGHAYSTVLEGVMYAKR